MEPTRIGLLPWSLLWTWLDLVLSYLEWEKALIFLLWVPLGCYFIPTLWFYFNNLLTNSWTWNLIESVSYSSFWPPPPLLIFLCPFAFLLFKYFMVFSHWELCDLCWQRWTWIFFHVAQVGVGSGDNPCPKWDNWRCSYWSKSKKAIVCIEIFT